jgi:SAM-dependent methyltransferase
MKQVKPKLYDQKYFDYQSMSPDFSQKLTTTNFHKKYQEIGNLIKLNSTDKVCDLGCGNGDLSFLLSLKYHCQIIAIDYSSDAIKICRSKLAQFKKTTSNQINLKFYNLDNLHLPKLKNVRAVYFCDVFEHLYPDEIKFVVATVSKWGSPDIVVHTDNNFYLKLIQPIINIISLITGKTTLKQIDQQKKFDSKRHVNLTNPHQLKKTMEKLGYQQTLLSYPGIDIQTIKSQLGSLSKFKLVVNLSLTLARLFPFLIPSFYSVYSQSHKDL